MIMPCPICGGEGEVELEPSHQRKFFIGYRLLCPEKKTCVNCFGFGFVVDDISDPPTVTTT